MYSQLYNWRCTVDIHSIGIKGFKASFSSFLFFCFLLYSPLHVIFCFEVGNVISTIPAWTVQFWPDWREWDPTTLCGIPVPGKIQNALGEIDYKLNVMTTMVSIDYWEKEMPMVAIESLLLCLWHNQRLSILWSESWFHYYLRFSIANLVHANHLIYKFFSELPNKLLDL